MNFKERVVNEFIELVKIDSISLEEKKLFDYLNDRIKCEKIFQEYSVEELGVSSGNLIIKIPANTSNAKSIFFDAHVDTVEPGRGIIPIVKNDEGRIVSSGNTILGSDDKAAVAAMVVAIEEILKNNFPHGDIYFLFTSAEEIGLIGIKHFDFSIIRPDFGFVLDSHDKVGRIVVAAPYHYKYKINIKGKASHAGIEPDKGINAIKVAAKIVSKLPQGKINKDTVANVGTIEGGKATNIVAENCEISGEFRSHSTYFIDKTKRKIEKIISKYKKEVIDIELDMKEMYKGFKYEINDDIVKYVTKALLSMGIKPIYEKSGGGSNTNIYNQNNIKALTLSIGMMNIHSTGEYIEIEDMVNLVKLILRLSEMTAYR
ncbi:MAG: M20/M25/M40 family metallo-hydrolase [Brevinematales bacterium]|nr:M20/M25/M40 family metallo-hydrolase [Brevinematales bacterium]